MKEVWRCESCGSDNVDIDEDGNPYCNYCECSTFILRESEYIDKMTEDEEEEES